MEPANFCKGQHHGVMLSTAEQAGGRLGDESDLSRSDMTDEAKSAESSSKVLSSKILFVCMRE